MDMESNILIWLNFIWLQYFAMIFFKNWNLSEIGFSPLFSVL